MLMTLLSMFSGGILRCIPEIIGYFNKKADNEHELNMLTAQTELEKVKQVGQAAQNATNEVLANLQATADALKGQMQQITIPITGVKFLDAIDAFMATVANILNVLVRPVTTYYFLALYGTYKAALLQQALLNTGSVWQSILQVYSPDDANMLAGILTFYFVGRVIDKANAAK